MWVLDEVGGEYRLSGPGGTLEGLTLDDLEILADLFEAEAVGADEWSLSHDLDLLDGEWRRGRPEIEYKVGNG